MRNLPYDKVLTLLKAIVKNMKGSSKDREETDRKHGIANSPRGRCEMDEHDLYKIIKDFNFECSLSGIPFGLTGFRFSPERVNESLGYVKGNVDPIVLELQNRYQWSVPKIREMHEELSRGCYEITHNFNKPPHRANRPALVLTEVKGIVSARCNDCKVVVPVTSFSGSQRCCKACHCVIARERRTKPLGAIQLMIEDAYSRHKLKLKKGFVHWIFSITEESVIKQFKKDKFRCHHSGMPIVFGEIGSHWKASLERIDVTKGYEVNNVVIVCMEFNGIDNSASTQVESGGWNKAKFQFFYDACRRKYAL